MATHRTATTRSPAQLYATVVGVVLLLVGVAGFFVNSDFHVGSDVMGDDLLIFMVNGWHNVVHLASGLFLLAVARRHDTARGGVLAFAVIYGVVTLYGLIDGDDVLHLLPVDGQDNVLHLVLTLAGLGAALAPRPEDDGARRGATPVGSTARPRAGS